VNGREDTFRQPEEEDFKAVGVQEWKEIIQDRER